MNGGDRKCVKMQRSGSESEDGCNDDGDGKEDARVVGKRRGQQVRVSD